MTAPSPPAADAAGGAEPSAPADEADAVSAAELAAAIADLQRERADYANYRRRMDRERAADRERTVMATLADLLPVLDNIERARAHGELVGGFKMVAESLEVSLGKLGLVPFGEAGDPFDPNVHEALMHEHSAEVTEPTCVEILQSGYKVGERIMRPARVKVAEPAE
ncbi:MAG: nucleotide exchange factor GrpE [Sporichthyaceae bacterium]